MNWEKNLKSLGISLVAAATTALAAWSSGSDFGMYTPFVTGAVAVLVNFLQMTIADWNKPETPTT